MLDHLRKAVEDGGQIIPLARSMGFRIASVALGEALIEFASGPEHANPMGTLHGGVLCTIADTAMGIAHTSTLEPGEASTTLELKINFLRPVWNARLRAIGKVTKGGRTISMLECDILDEKDRLVARASSTCMTLRGEQAEGRRVVPAGPTDE